MNSAIGMYTEILKWCVWHCICNTGDGRHRCTSILCGCHLFIKKCYGFLSLLMQFNFRSTEILLDFALDGWFFFILDEWFFCFSFICQCFVWELFTRNISRLSDVRYCGGWHGSYYSAFFPIISKRWNELLNSIKLSEFRSNINLSRWQVLNYIWIFQLLAFSRNSIGCYSKIFDAIVAYFNQ